MGQYATKLLGDLGADVIKVEPPGGDPWRAVGPFYRDDPDREKSLLWWSWNTSKRSITLDIATADGRALLVELSRRADVLVETFPPGFLEGLGVGYSRLRGGNPGLIYCSVTGFGLEGPHAHWLAHDLLGIAMSGIMHLAGYPDRAPVRPPGFQGFLSASIQAAQGILIALYGRENGGPGQLVEVSMQEALSLAQETAMQTYDMRKEVRGRQGDVHLLPGVGTYECADGYVYSMVGVPGFGAPWSVLGQWMDENGMAEDLMAARWQTLLANINLRELTALWSQPDKLAAMMQKFQHVDSVLRRFYKSKSKRELYEEGQGRRLLIGPVNSPRDLIENRQLEAREYFQHVHHDELDATVVYPGPPFRLAKSPWAIRRRPPLIGEHNREVYREELGLKPEEIDALAGAGVI